MLAALLRRWQIKWQITSSLSCNRFLALSFPITLHLLGQADDQQVQCTTQKQARKACANNGTPIAYPKVQRSDQGAFPEVFLQRQDLARRSKALLPPLRKGIKPPAEKKYSSHIDSKERLSYFCLIKTSRKPQAKFDSNFWLSLKKIKKNLLYLIDFRKLYVYKLNVHLTIYQGAKNGPI